MVEPLLVKVRDVLEVLDRVLEKRDPVADAYLFAVDVMEALDDGTARLEDPSMRPPLEALAASPVVRHELIEQIRAELGRGKDHGSA